MYVWFSIWIYIRNNVMGLVHLKKEERKSIPIVKPINFSCSVKIDLLATA